MPDAEAVGAERVTDAWPTQGDLLGLPAVPESAAAAIERRKAGRPAGARNRRSEDVAEEVIARLGDPLLRQAAVATMDAEELAKRLGCTLLEAIQEQRLSAMLVLPYLHRKMPIAVDVRAQRVVQLTIVDVPAPDGQSEQNQEVAVVVDGQV